jgi:hypothetical protein
VHVLEMYTVQVYNSSCCKPFPCDSFRQKLFSVNRTLGNESVVQDFYFFGGKICLRINMFSQQFFVISSRRPTQ